MNVIDLSVLVALAGWGGCIAATTADLLQTAATRAFYFDGLNPSFE